MQNWLWWNVRGVVPSVLAGYLRPRLCFGTVFNMPFNKAGFSPLGKPWRDIKGSWTYLLTKVNFGNENDCNLVLINKYYIRKSQIQLRDVYLFWKASPALTQWNGQRQCWTSWHHGLWNIVLSGAEDENLQHKIKPFKHFEWWKSIDDWKLDKGPIRDKEVLLKGPRVVLGLEPVTFHHCLIYNTWLLNNKTGLAQVATLDKASPRSRACFLKRHV